MVKKIQAHKILVNVAILLLTIPILLLSQRLFVQAADIVITASSDSHSTIDPSGSIIVNQGSSQSFRYSANTGNVVTRVLVDGSPVTINGNYIFTNTKVNHSITVSASIINFTITSSNDTHSTITPSGTVQVPYGSSQSFSYSASADYSISNVVVDGSSTAIAGNFTFTNVQANHVITVNSKSTPKPTPIPTPTNSPTPTPTATSTTPTPPKSEPTSQPILNSIPTQQQLNPTTPPTNNPSTPPSPKPTSTPKPNYITPTTQPTDSLNPNATVQNQTYPAAAAAATITGVTVAATIMIKKRQQPNETLDDFDGQTE
jgi:hypothetical protein